MTTYASKHKQNSKSQRPQRPYKATFLKKSHFKRNLLLLTAVTFLVIVAVYSLAQSGAGSSAQTFQISNSAWKTAPLTNALTGESFNLTQFSGKVIVLQFMAVYCQNCLAEGQQLVSVQHTLGNGNAAGQVVMVSVDVDPNENLAQLKSYAQQNGFGAGSNPTWIYAKDATGQLLQSIAGTVDFGSFISLTHMYFVDRQQSNNFLSMQRTPLQDANPASDIVAVVYKLL